MEIFVLYCLEFFVQEVKFYLRILPIPSNVTLALRFCCLSACKYQAPGIKRDVPNSIPNFFLELLLVLNPEEVFHRLAG